MGSLSLEQSLQKMSPHDRQWCCVRSEECVRSESKGGMRNLLVLEYTVCEPI